MHFLILGATRGMGRSIARQCAERGNAVILLGRDEDELDRSAADLRVRAPQVQVDTLRCDLSEPESFSDVMERAWAIAPRIDAVVITAAAFGTQDELEADIDRAYRLLALNLASTVAFCEHARRRLLAQGGGTLCVFSSVAGERGRKPVGIYGASKAGLSHYLESLDHRYRADGLVTVCVKPGFVHTDMTAGLSPPPFAGQPDEVAARVLKAIDRGTPVVYAPPMWALVMLVIRTLPRFVMRRVGF